MKLYHAIARERLDEIKRNGIVYRGDPSEIVWVFDFFGGGSYSLTSVHLSVFFEDANQARTFGIKVYENYMLAECYFDDEELLKQTNFGGYYRFDKVVVEPYRILHMFL